jgi:flavin-dependent dehydrogenase
VNADAHVRGRLRALAQTSIPSACDVAVVGGGPAGSAAARRLALAGARVVLIERSHFQWPRIGESLAPAVQPELIALGVWREFRALDPLPSYGTRSHWGDAAGSAHSHLMSPWGSGWHVDRRAFDTMLAEAAERAGAVVATGAAVVDVRHSAGARTLVLRTCGDVSGGASDKDLHARVIIDATGRAASMSAACGAGRVVIDHLVGVACAFSGIDVAREGYVMVETTAEGWWYSAPVPSGALVVMAMTDGDICGRSRLASHDRWSAHLETAPATKTRTGGGRLLWGPRAFSAASHRLIRRDRRSPCLAVGDASLAVDPISGSGVVRALRTASAGAEAALALLNGGGSEIIRAYEADRDAECTAYLDERATYYGLERRWSTSPFWARRARVSEIAS